MTDVKLHEGLEDDPTEGGLATVGEAAAYLRMGRSWIYSAMDAGQLRYVKLGRSRRIPWAAIKQLARDSMVGASD
jgi:excisionase family DNA binding protein